MKGPKGTVNPMSKGQQEAGSWGDKWVGVDGCWNQVRKTFLGETCEALQAALKKSLGFCSKCDESQWNDSEQGYSLSFERIIPAVLWEKGGEGTESG